VRGATGSVGPRFDLAVLSVDIDDALVPYELAAFPDREFYRNAGRSTRRGLEAALRLNPLDGLTADLSYTYSDFYYEEYVSLGQDFGGNQLPGVPRHFAQPASDIL
jgi:Outer membrane receptor for ferrienterochelin and colicins